MDIPLEYDMRRLLELMSPGCRRTRFRTAPRCGYGYGSGIEVDEAGVEGDEV